MSRLILALFSLLLPGIVIGQGITLSGKVVDDLGQPLEYAGIELFLDSDSTLVSGSISNDKGLFELNNVPIGRYYLNVSYIGFTDKIISGVVVDETMTSLRVDDILLELSSHEMDQVVVSATQYSVKTKLDKKVIRINDEISSGTENAIDILEKSPSLSVDFEGQLTLRGNSNVTILIDGIPIVGDDNNVLSTMPVQTIDKIEIITNPSVKYRADGTAGIINILTKKSKINNLNILASAKVGTDNKYAANINALYKKNRYSFHGQLNYSDFEKYANSIRTRTLFNEKDTTYFRDDFKNRRYYDINNYIAIGNGLRFNNLNLFLNTKYGLFELYKEKNGLQQQWTESPATFHNLWNSNEGSIKWYYLENNLNIGYTSDDKKHTYDGVLFHAYEDGRDIYNTATYDVDEHVHKIGDEKRIQSRQDGVYRYYQMSGDYAYKLDSASTIEAGIFYKLMDRNHLYKQGVYDANRMAWDYAPALTNDISIAHNEYAGYLNYKQQISKLSYQVGLRVEIDDRTIDTDADGTKRTHMYRVTNLFPSLAASYRLSDVLTYRLSFSRRKKLPRPWQIVPYSYAQDKYVTFLGNVELKPEYAYKYETGLLIKAGKYSGDATLYLNDTTDEIWALTIIGEDKTSRSQVVNVDKHVAAGIEVDNTFRLSKALFINLGGSLYTNRYSGYIQNIATTNQNTAWSAKARINFKFLKDTQLSILSSYSSEYAYLQGKFDPYYFTNISIRRSFLGKKLSVSLAFNDILHTTRFNGRHWQWKDFDGYYSNRKRRFLLLGVTYNFNKYSFKNKAVKVKRGAL